MKVEDYFIHLLTYSPRHEGFSPLFYYFEEKTTCLDHCITHSWYWTIVLGHGFDSSTVFIHCIERSKRLYKLDPLHLHFIFGSLEIGRDYFIGNKETSLVLFALHVWYVLLDY